MQPLDVNNLPVPVNCINPDGRTYHSQYKKKRQISVCAILHIKFPNVPLSLALAGHCLGLANQHQNAN